MGLRRKEIVSEVKKQLWLAGPMISVGLFIYSLQIISIMFAGHLGELSLSGAAMATAFLSAFGGRVLMGMASALDTFCGQSYGAEQYHMLGIHMQRGMLVIILVAVVQSIILAYLGPILVLLHQDHNIAREAGVYARYIIPSLFAFGLVQCNIKFLQNQNIVFPMVLTTGISTLLHILFCWVLVIKAGLGIKGAAIAYCMSCWINFLLLTLYIKFSSSCKRTWTGFSREAFHNIPQFLRLALSSAIMLCLESWTFELMVILSGIFPNPKLQTSVSSICINTAGIFWMLPSGVGAAVCTRISNELGAGSPKAAQLALRVTLFMALILGASEFSLLMIIRNIWGAAFTNVYEVVRYLASMTPIVASILFMDSFQTVLSGVARGCGWQKLGAFANLCAYYIVGIPLALVFSIVFHMKVKGLLIGLALAIIVQVVCLLLITLCTDWEKEAKRAELRVQGNGVPASNQTVAEP